MFESLIHIWSIVTGLRAKIHLQTLKVSFLSSDMVIGPLLMPYLEEIHVVVVE